MVCIKVYNYNFSPIPPVLYCVKTTHQFINDFSFMIRHRWPWSMGAFRLNFSVHILSFRDWTELAMDQTGSMIFSLVHDNFLANSDNLTI